MQLRIKKEGKFRRMHVWQPIEVSFDPLENKMIDIASAYFTVRTVCQATTMTSLE